MRHRLLSSLAVLNSLELHYRSSYFQQIEEDVEKYAKPILQLKGEISSFQTKDMAELVKFHKHVEKCLECLTDESQVLNFSYVEVGLLILLHFIHTQRHTRRHTHI